MDIAQILGWIATVLFTVCFIPQIMKMLKTKAIDGLSFLFLFITFVANIIALVYATLIGQPPLQIKYTLAILLLGLILFLYVKTWIRNKEDIIASTLEK